MFQLLKFESTNTGFRPNLITQSAVEIIEKEGIIISDPFLKLSAFKEISSAAVPLEVVTPNFLEIYFEN